jgi:tetratricopeptide (TPR) repeat protein
MNINHEDYLNELMLHARQFVENQDIYNAAKLFRRIVKLAPDWWEPHSELAELYKWQGEWKAMMHYAKRAVALQAGNPAAWRNLGIAATALKKERIAKTVWQKFGHSPESVDDRAVVALRVPCAKFFEILWARPLDPASACLSSIPSPASGRRYRDILIFNFAPCGYTVSGRKRYPVFDQLGILRHSPFHTFSCTVDTTERKTLRLLDRLCRQAGLGFDNWTMAARAMTFQSEIYMPEFYGSQVLPSSSGTSQIAIAARQRADAEAVIKDWGIITLCGVSDLEQLN